jgi:hypothetical protein
MRSGIIFKGTISSTRREFVTKYSYELVVKQLCSLSGKGVLFHEFISSVLGSNFHKKNYHYYQKKATSIVT